MSINISDITITSIETITAFDVNTGDLMFVLDELSSSNIAQTEERTDITGKQGRRLNSLKRNKNVTISGSNGLVSAGLLSVQTGGEFENKQTTVMWTDYLTVSSNASATTYKAVGTAGAEIEHLYIKNSDGTLGTELQQAASAGAGKFTYDPATKALGFHSGDIADNTEIVVYYFRKVLANVLDNMSDNHSGKATLYVDAMAEDNCNNVMRVQFYFPKVDFNGEFSFDMGDNQTVHSFEAQTIMASKCSIAKSGLLWTYTIFGVNTADAPALSSIAITSAPTRTSYTAGEAFNVTGMVVTASYEDGTSKAVTGYTFSPTTALATTDSAVTITYTEDGVTKTATQAITVTP